MSGLGDMRTRLAFEKAVDAPDGAGGAARTFNAIADVWGALEPVSGRAAFVAAREELKVTHRIRIRWRNDVEIADRFRQLDRIFIVRGLLDPDERRVILECLCEEIV